MPGGGAFRFLSPRNSELTVEKRKRFTLYKIFEFECRQVYSAFILYLVKRKMIEDNFHARLYWRTEKIRHCDCSDNAPVCQDYADTSETRGNTWPDFHYCCNPKPRLEQNLIQEMFLSVRPATWQYRKHGMIYSINLKYTLLKIYYYVYYKIRTEWRHFSQILLNIARYFPLLLVYILLVAFHSSTRRVFWAHTSNRHSEKLMTMRWKDLLQIRQIDWDDRSAYLIDNYW